jgi:acyl-coenzyme A synthetase/AMP-(fatty) acid ligase
MDFKCCLESALMAHPKIKEAAVIAIADENG